LDRFRGLLRKSLLKRTSYRANVGYNVGDADSESINANLSLNFNLFKKFSFKMKPKIAISTVNEYKISRKLLFVRENDNNMNLFEKILSNNFEGNGEFISLVWTECELWRDDSILVATNPHRKIPIDSHIISSGSIHLDLRCYYYLYS
jgi:hypothetical protein